jgi:thiamine-monophosphate kinase
MTRRLQFSSESALIEKLFAPLAASNPGALGLRDDAALIAPSPGEEHVITTDTVTAGVHFLSNGNPGEARSIACKALGTNVSDLAAKGATPRAYLLALGLPDTLSTDWLEQFAAGLADRQDRWGLSLIGGDTTRTPGPLTITVTAIGSVPAGRMVRRDTARVGDLVFVTGTVGDAGLGLRLAREDTGTAHWPARIGNPACEWLIERYRRPEPRLALGPALLRHAAAALDISDGLMLDMNRLCAASSVGARIELPKLPLSAAARALLQAGEIGLPQLATAGDDYEILCTVPADVAGLFQADAGAAGVAVTCIGKILEFAAGLTSVDAAGVPVNTGRGGWDHLA